MGSRRMSRELAMQALFYMDTQGISEDRLELFTKCQSVAKENIDFFNRIVKGVILNIAHLNTLIERFSNNWKVERMACVDRNLLRIAIYELIYCADIPSSVSINEAVDIGKKFGTQDSGSFINGILDSIRIALENGDIESFFNDKRDCDMKKKDKE